MRTTGKLASVTGAVALTVGLLGASAGAAGAAAVPQGAADCPSTYFCVWSGQNYTGHRQQVAGTNADLTKYAVFQSFKSWYNHGASCAFEWFSATQFRGSSGTIAKGYKTSDSVSHYMKSNKWAC
ncbi:peptidase inhibitor family I36 protein [Streptomyces sp. NBC_00083]|uniref:peptidase inhibitor family I36 protein n=1 Tax=Streptomyces sp. NBC_00083 TaxID=2975647 RepID=UPI00224F737C|nr:peptidase inhibitor family I36 protein [Streptomyces sp. NBC_00083]MCX5384373.1 peptidase inhibitor family I36 protein [Streptomyces sp. NBC_00083]